ncbi:MAG: hypothetical protein OEZ58_15085 [Gammaproteobacteria bacterium]|nr:hypothetical protein [Gammaproteobacteria bacterium]
MLKLRNIGNLKQLLFILLMGVGANLCAQESNSLSAWKSRVIDPVGHPQVQLAQQVFSRLLRTWRAYRVEPRLAVVRSDRGLWAASLENGDILLSESALTFIAQFPRSQQRHLLAFIFAHEIAHQQANDLWHYQFFRLDDTQGSNQTFVALQQLEQAAIAAKEAQADYDALLIMAAVGFDPIQVYAHNQFLRAWVTQNQKLDCIETDVKHSLCQIAQDRSQRLASQWQYVLQQSSIYELGLYSFALGDYQQAIQYFQSHTQTTVSPILFNMIGLSHLLIAQSALAEQSNNMRQPHFPLMVYNNTQSESVQIAKRSATLSEEDIQQHLDKSIESFERAIQVWPDFANAYLNLVYAYVLQKNAAMAQGVLIGKFKKRFEQSADIELMQAIIDMGNGRLNQALARLEKLKPKQTKSIFPAQALQASVYENINRILQQQKQSDQLTQLWQTMFEQQRDNGNLLLFRQAQHYLLGNNPMHRQRAMQPIKRTLTKPQHAQIWFGGEALKVEWADDGNKTIYQSNGQVLLEHVVNQNYSAGIRIGDRADRLFKQFGDPAQVFYTRLGYYYAYPQQGLLFYLQDDQLMSWTYYRAN